MENSSIVYNETLDYDIELEKRITKILKHINMPANITGYYMVREAGLRVVKEPQLISDVNKVMYSDIGEKFSTSYKNVERGIGRAIKKVWNKENSAELYAYFGYSTKIKDRPTNREFIGMLADKIRFDMD